jgi:hypothetical protein
MGLRLLVDLKKVLRSVKPDLVHAGPIQRAAFLTALAGFRPLVSMSWGYDLLVDAERSRSMALGNPLYAQEKLCHGWGLQYDKRAGDSLRDGGRARRDLPMGCRSG